MTRFDVWAWWRRIRGKGQTAAVVAQPPPKPAPPQPFRTDASCATCGFNKNNEGRWLEAPPQRVEAGECSIRVFAIERPAETYCKNHATRGSELKGTIYSVVEDGQCLPWFELAAPRRGSGTCVICEAQGEGFVLALKDEEMHACGVEHYFQWWADYEERWLEYFKLTGEREYSLMYDAIRPGSATGYYSNAKEAFYAALATARDLEWEEERIALAARLQHIKDVFRSQF